jgi:hypothetical protein
MPTRLEKPPRGPHVAEAYYVRSVWEYQKAMKPGLSQRHFALETLDVSWTAWNNWVDGKSRIRSDSMAKLRKYAPPGLAGPLGSVGDLASDPRPPYDSPPPTLAREYAAMTNQGAIIAQMLDRIADDYERTMAMNACITEMKRNPRGVVTDPGPDRPTGSKPPPAK